MTGSNQYDAVVVGGGHNGLIAAAMLAQNGANVCVLERSDKIGGMARNDAIGADIQSSRIAHLVYNFDPSLFKGLDLERAVKLKPLSTIALSADGNHVEIKGGNISYTKGSSHPDSKAYAKIQSDLVKFAKLLNVLAKNAPPGNPANDAASAKLFEIMRYAKLGLDLKRMGKRDMQEFLRIVLTNIFDYALDQMEDGPMAGSLAFDAVKGSWAGPRSPGTLLALLYRSMGGNDVALPVGGMGAISEAIASKATKMGVDIRLNSEATRVLLENDQVVGVELSDGSQLKAGVVLTSVAARNAMLMAGPGHYDTESVRRLRNLRNKGNSAKVNLVLRQMPEFTGLSADQAANRLLVTPSAADVERAFDCIKYGRYSDEPILEVVKTSSADQSSVVLSVVVQYVPYALEGGWNDKARELLLNQVINTLARYAPDLGSLIESSEILTPVDIEKLTGAPEGHWHHAEWCIDQWLLVRPVNGLGHYRFGPKGYYLCGASAHPGGDVNGLAGRNAALQVLKDGVLA